MNVMIKTGKTTTSMQWQGARTKVQHLIEQLTSFYYKKTPKNQKKQNTKKSQQKQKKKALSTKYYQLLELLSWGSSQSAVRASEKNLSREEGGYHQQTSRKSLSEHHCSARIWKPSLISTGESFNSVHISTAVTHLVRRATNT